MFPSASTATGLSMWLSRCGSTSSSTLPSAKRRRNAASSSPALSPAADRASVGLSMSGIKSAHARLKAHEAEQRVDLRRRFADGRPDLVHRAQQRVDLGRLAGFQILQHRSEEHTSELQSRLHLVCRLLLEKKKKKKI